MGGSAGNAKILKKRQKSVEIVAIVVGVSLLSRSHLGCVGDMSRTYPRLWEYAGCRRQVLELNKRESQTENKEITKQRSCHLSHIRRGSTTR